MRARRDQEGDFNALDRCLPGGRAQPDRHARQIRPEDRRYLHQRIARHGRPPYARSHPTVPDGTYEGVAILEDAGHGFGDFEIKATVTIKKDTCHIVIASPPQIPYFINSYEGNSHSGVYLGLMMFAALPPPYNEGLYRCVIGGFRAEGHDLQCRRTGTAHELHHDADGNADRCRAACFREGHAIESRGIMGPCQRTERGGLGFAHQRGIRHHGAGHHHLRRRRHAAAGRLACGGSGMLLWRADIGRRRAARIFLSRSSSTTIR